MKATGERKFADPAGMDLAICTLGLISWKDGNAFGTVEILVCVLLRKHTLQTGSLLFSQSLVSCKSFFAHSALNVISRRAVVAAFFWTFQILTFPQNINHVLEVFLVAQLAKAMLTLIKHVQQLQLLLLLFAHRASQLLAEYAHLLRDHVKLLFIVLLQTDLRHFCCSQHAVGFTRLAGFSWDLLFKAHHFTIDRT